MNYILVMIVLSNNPLGRNVPVATTSTLFTSQQSCMKALSSILEMENMSVKIKARCVQQ